MILLKDINNKDRFIYPYQRKLEILNTLFLSKNIDYNKFNKNTFVNKGCQYDIFISAIKERTQLEEISAIQPNYWAYSIIGL